MTGREEQENQQIFKDPLRQAILHSLLRQAENKKIAIRLFNQCYCVSETLYSKVRSHDSNRGQQNIRRSHWALHWNSQTHHTHRSGILEGLDWRIWKIQKIQSFNDLDLDFFHERSNPQSNPTRKALNCH